MPKKYSAPTQKDKKKAVNAEKLFSPSFDIHGFLSLNSGTLNQE